MVKKENTYVKPFLRWAGGKSWLIKHLSSIIGNCPFNRYHEPFLGGGSVFFYLSPPSTSYLSDLNSELIATYCAVKEDPEGVLSKLEEFSNTSEQYYKIRATRPTSSIDIAARFIYLNQTSFNGIYRVNAHGNYNVPYGYRRKSFIEKDKLLSASKALQNAHLQVGDFECVRDNIAAGDLVFLDPPYTTSHNNNGFIKYNQKLFSLEDQYRLKALIDDIRSCGAYYILTNAAHDTIFNIFHTESEKYFSLSRASLIGGENANRGLVQEYVFTNLSGGV